MRTTNDVYMLMLMYKPFLSMLKMNAVNLYVIYIAQYLISNEEILLFFY